MTATDAWRGYASAPDEGAAVIALRDLPAGATALTLKGPRGAFPVIALRAGDGLRAWVNACPHQFLPLDHHGPNILSADGTRLMCTVHGAQFGAEDGVGVAGPGLGCALDPFPVHVDDAGMIRVGAGVGRGA